MIETNEQSSEPISANKNSSQRHENVVFVGGVPKTLNDDHGLKVDMSHALFEEWARNTFGEAILCVNLRMNNRSKCLGYGFLTFKKKENALAALKLHGCTCMGSVVEIKPVKQQTNSGHAQEPQKALVMTLPSL